MMRVLIFTLLFWIFACTFQTDTAACFYRYELDSEDYNLRGVPDVLGKFNDHLWNEYTSGKTWPPIGRNGKFVYQDVCGQTEFSTDTLTALRELGVEFLFEPISDEEYFEIYNESRESNTH